MTEDKRPKKRSKRVILAILLLGLLAIAARLSSGLNEVMTGIVMEPIGFLMDRMSGPSNYIHAFLLDLSHFNGLRSDNKRLRLELAELRRELNRYREQALENARLKSLLRIKNSVPGDFLVAQVVGFDLAPWRSFITINRGLKDGVEPDDVVLAGGGVIGRILNTTIHYSRVMLLTDRNSHIPALVQRSRARGILEGAGDGMCNLQFVEKGADVVEGDKVVTSGVGEFFPKGLLLGTVVRVDDGDGDNGLFKIVEVRPVVDLDRLEELLVMIRPRAR